MPTQVNANYSANFQKFVDFAAKAYATKGEDTVARFEGMPKGDHKGAFASFWRTSEMKTANDQVRDLFRKTVADMFGGEKFIPDLVRDNMKLEDFGKGKPLTARRINLVKIAIDTLGGGKFQDAASVGKATSMGYVSSELPKLARVANIYQQATGCTDAEAETAALDPNSKARRLFDCGGRFNLNAENFKKGLALMDKFPAWFSNLHDDYAAGKHDTTTKLNLNAGICNRNAEKAVAKFLLEEIAVNPNIPLDAENPEDAFGMANNPAMRFVGRNYTMSFANSLAQIPPEKRSVLYAVFDAFDKIPTNADELANRREISQGTLLAARVIKNFDAVVALKAEGKLDRANLVPLLYPDFNLPPAADNAQINDAYDELISRRPSIIMQVHMVAAKTGVPIDAAVDAVINNRHIENLQWVASYSGSLEQLDGTAAGGRKTMLGDLHRPTTPTLTESKELAIPFENAKFVFNFPGGEKLVAEAGADNSQKVTDANNAIADKLAELCGRAHPKQLANVYYALSQSSIGGNTKGGLAQYGIASDEHIAVTFTISRNDDTGAVTIKYSEPKDLPVKFNWTTTIDVDGGSVTTPMRVDHGQYEAKAMTFADQVANYVPGKDKAVAEAMIKDMLAHCGDDFELKDIVSQTIRGLCITGTAKLRTMDQIKARIDAVRANLEEVRRAAAGSQAIENAGCYFLSGMNGKSVPPGLIGKIVKAASAEKPGDFANLSATSTPQQIAKAVIDMRAAVENTIHSSYVQDYLEGADEMGPAREFAFSLLVAKFSPAQLTNVNAAFRSETASKLFAVLDDFINYTYPAGIGPISRSLPSWIDDECTAIEQVASQYTQTVERLLGKEHGGRVREFGEEFDKAAFGAKEVFDMIVPLAENDIRIDAETERRNGLVRDGTRVAKTKATNAYSKAGEGNAVKVDKLINIALKHCAANEDAVNIVANNIDTMLVSATAKLRSIEQVRELSKAVAANFAELKELSKDNPAVYEAGKRMMSALKGKSLPPGTIAKLVAEAANAKITAVRRLSPRASGIEIHRAITEFRDNLMNIMTSSGAEMAADGAPEKQACRNFISTLIMGRFDANALRAMQGAFGGDVPGKMVALYSEVSRGRMNQGLEHRVAAQFEDQADSHMMNIANLKGAIDVALDGRFGADIVPFEGEFDADGISAGEIIDDLLDHASR